LSKRWTDGASIDVVAHLNAMQDFRRLRVWQSAHELSLAIKQVIRTCPRSWSGDSKSQLIRAADSIVGNIVEGCRAATRKEFARYLDIALKSASEVDYRLQLARDEGAINYKVWEPLFEHTVEVRKMLFALRKAVVAADEAERKKRPRRRGRGTNDQ